MTQRTRDTVSGCVLMVAGVVLGVAGTLFGIGVQAGTEPAPDNHPTDPCAVYKSAADDAHRRLGALVHGMEEWLTWSLRGQYDRGRAAGKASLVAAGYECVRVPDRALLGIGEAKTYRIKCEPHE